MRSKLPMVVTAAQSIVMAHCRDAHTGVYWARVPFTRRMIRMASHKKGKGSPSRSVSTHAGGQAASARRAPNSGQTSDASQGGAAVATAPTARDEVGGKTAKPNAASSVRTVRSAPNRNPQFRSKMNRHKRRQQRQVQIVGASLAVIAVAALAFFLWPRPPAPSKASVSATATAKACTTTAQTGLSGTPASAGGPAPVTGQLVTLPGCLKYVDMKVGTGQAITADDVKNQVQVTVDYTGWLVDGTKFDSSADNGGPASFQLGQVIPGWNQGLVGMKVGGERRLIIPPDLAYGANGQGPIPANATLIFDVTLNKIG
jgi:FKBP-type peptidyl-prolyl cis-trans isomerase